MYIRYREWLFLYICKYGVNRVKNFEVKMKNPLDNIVSKNDINLSAALDFMHKKLCVKAITVKSADWQTQISGIVKNYASSNLKNINLDLDINIPASDIHSMYWLVPSIEGDSFDVMQKFKKYGAWGKAKGQLKIKGSAALPEIYGNLEADDVYIVKDNPLVPHCKVFAEFLKDYVKVKTRVYAGHGEYVDIDGIAQMKFYGKGDFQAAASGRARKRGQRARAFAPHHAGSQTLRFRPRGTL